MRRPIFYILDVFAETKYAGNQLAVVRCTDPMSDIEMQKIAKEMNFSETSFILSGKERNGGYDVRIFTPEKEVPFAGHPTLGTAFVIKNEIAKGGVNKIVLNLKVGQIPIIRKHLASEGNSDVLWMKQLHPTFGRCIDPALIPEVLGLDVQEIDTAHPIQEVSTGLPFVIVPLRTLSAVKSARISGDNYSTFIETREAKAIMVFCSETYNRQNDLHARVFANYYGIKEDPATGSANGCLAGYLVKNRYFGKSHIDLRVEQGYEIGRPSLLFLNAEEKAGIIDIQVGGEVIMVAEGRLF